MVGIISSVMREGERERGKVRRGRWRGEKMREGGKEGRLGGGREEKSWEGGDEGREERGRERL